MLIKAHGLLSVNSCYAKGNELTPRIHSQLIVGREFFSQFPQCLYDKMGQFSVELLDPWLNGNMLGFLNLSSARNSWRKIFCGKQAGVGLRKSRKFLSHEIR